VSRQTASPRTLFAARPAVAAQADLLAATLARAADPTGAPARAVEVLDAASAADAARLAALLERRGDAVARVLAALCGSAPFLVSKLVRHPEWLFTLAEDDLAIARTRAEYQTRLRTVLDARPRAEVGAMLRRFKYLELARITVRDLADDLVPLAQAGVPLAELSHLADALLDAALDIAAAHVAARTGTASEMGGRAAVPSRGFVVLGLGKLGAEELNYSSDVDLLYVYENTADAGIAEPAPVEHATRLAQEFGRLVSEGTEEGFLYRVDLDLRPEGTKGPLVVSTDMLLRYHEIRAATWERAVYMKARPVAGDLVLGWRVIRALAPMIYRSTMDFETVAAIKDLRDRAERETVRPGEPFHVKIGAGGIRDVESVAQALQLLHGGRIPEVRARGTEAALLSLAQVGILPRDDAEPLLTAYRFLRRTENRLQMVAERQTHRLPHDRADLECVARGLGFGGEDPAAGFETALAGHRDHVQRVAAALFHRGSREQIVDLFGRRVPRLLANPLTRSVLEELAAAFAREIEAAPYPQRAMNNLDRFVEGVGVRSFYYQLLLDRPELVSRLTVLFSASEYLSSYLARHPRLIEPIFHDPGVLLLDRPALVANFAAVETELSREQDSDADPTLDALRLALHREVLNVGLLDLDGKVSRAETEAALSEIAEVCLGRGLELARTQLERQKSAPPAGFEFLVIGMGKLASRELTYGSDLDVIFLYDGAEEAAPLGAQEYFVRLAQKLIWALRTPTAAGFCYDIDARLRPSGTQGTLVTSLRSFERYHDTSAQVWERQALLRARPVAGSEGLGTRFDRLRRGILRRPLPPNLGREVHRIRLRMESELGRETLARRNFKIGRGGTQDVETVVQFLQLSHGATHPALFEVEPVAVHLDRLSTLRLLDTDDAQTLTLGWEFLQHLAARLRIVENRSISDLDAERGDLDALARALGYGIAGRPGSARRALLDEYRRHTEAIRSVYRRVLEVEGDATVS
jgi:glutamate-ammonia-ligase adenylyltransferase